MSRETRVWPPLAHSRLERAPFTSLVAGHRVHGSQIPKPFPLTTPEITHPLRHLRTIYGGQSTRRTDQSRPLRRGSRPAPPVRVISRHPDSPSPVLVPAPPIPLPLPHPHPQPLPLPLPFSPSPSCRPAQHEPQSATNLRKG